MFSEWESKFVSRCISISLRLIGFISIVILHWLNYSNVPRKGFIGTINRWGYGLMLTPIDNNLWNKHRDHWNKRDSTERMRLRQSIYKATRRNNFVKGKSKHQLETTQHGQSKWGYTNNVVLTWGKGLLQLVRLLRVEETKTQRVCRYLEQRTLNFTTSLLLLIFTERASFLLAVRRKSLISWICFGCSNK